VLKTAGVRTSIFDHDGGYDVHCDAFDEKLLRFSDHNNAHEWESLLKSYGFNARVDEDDDHDSHDSDDHHHHHGHHDDPEVPGHDHYRLHYHLDESINPHFATERSAKTFLLFLKTAKVSSAHIDPHGSGFDVHCGSFGDRSLSFPSEKTAQAWRHLMQSYGIHAHIDPLHHDGD
jgi:hypothetical protein